MVIEKRLFSLKHIVFHLLMAQKSKMKLFLKTDFDSIRGAIHREVFSNDQDALQKRFLAGEDLNEAIEHTSKKTTCSKVTPFDVACACENHIDLIKWFLTDQTMSSGEQKRPIGKITPKNYQALDLAVRCGEVSTLDWLLEIPEYQVYLSDNIDVMRAFFTYVDHREARVCSIFTNYNPIYFDQLFKVLCENNEISYIMHHVISQGHMPSQETLDISLKIASQKDKVDLVKFLLKQTSADLAKVPTKDRGHKVTAWLATQAVSKPIFFRGEPEVEPEPVAQTNPRKQAKRRKVIP